MKVAIIMPAYGGFMRQLRERIEQLLAEPELAQRMGRAGQKKVFRLYEMEKRLNRLVLLLEHAIQAWKAMREESHAAL